MQGGDPERIPIRCGLRSCVRPVCRGPRPLAQMGSAMPPPQLGRVEPAGTGETTSIASQRDASPRARRVGGAQGVAGVDHDADMEAAVKARPASI